MTSLFRNTGKPLRVAVYHRIAHPDEYVVCSSELLKERWCREIDQNENVIISDYYLDDSPVGAQASPERERLMADCRAGKIDFVMTRNIRGFCSDDGFFPDAVRELNSLTPPVDVYISMENSQLRQESDSR